MNFAKQFCRYWVLFLIPAFISLYPPPEIRAAGWGASVTPTDVYYLAKSIDDSLVAMYGLTYEFNKKRISNNLRPRNSYQKLLSVADEFNLLHGNVLNRSKLNEARQVDVVNTKPRDLLNILSLIKDYLVSQGAYVEHMGPETAKTPSDVTHMLRQISYHHIEIAKQKNIVTNWSTPALVYDAIVREILPAVQEVAREVGYKYKPYDFPVQPVKAIIPRNITKLLQYIYKNLSDYYVKKGDYDPLVLIEVNDCDTIEPGDSFDLIKAISAELKAMSGKRTPNSDTDSRYEKWKNAKSKIVPGDVFRLLQYNYIMSKRILQTVKKN